MRYLSLLKSSFHDPRCCDTADAVVDSRQTAWRSLITSLSCVLDGDANNTGYVHVGTLEQYFTDTNGPTGTTKPNVASDANYIPDYRDTGMCPLPDTGPAMSVVYAFNGCSGILVIQLTNTVTSDTVNIDVPPTGNITQAIPAGTYDVQMHCSQTGGLHVNMVCNSTLVVAASDDNRAINGQTTAINISVHPTNADIT